MLAAAARRVKKKDVLVELNRFRDGLLSDGGTAAPVLMALVGDGVIEARTVEEHSKPQMVARFTIDALPAIAAVRRGKAVAADDRTTDLWESLNADRWTMMRNRDPKTSRSGPRSDWLRPWNQEPAVRTRCRFRTL